MDFKIALLARLCRLLPGDRFRLVNGDGTVFVVSSKAHDAMQIEATPVLRYPYNLPKFTDYVELLSPTTSEVYAAYEKQHLKTAVVISCHLTLKSAYKALFKRRNDEWYSQRSKCVGDFHRTLNITLPRLGQGYFVKKLKLVTGELYAEL